MARLLPNINDDFYDISDPRAVIREVQKFLLELAYANNYLPLITIDGIYGDKTRQAVIIFQNRYELPPTGEVNPRTWALLVDKFLQAREYRLNGNPV